MIDFKIAKQADGVGALTLLTALSTTPITSCTPIATFQPAQELENLMDGSSSAAGAPSADLLFPIVTIAEYAKLKTYEGWVYIRTINDAGVYANYLGYLAWPVSPPRIKGGLISELTLHFQSLVVQA